MGGSICVGIREEDGTEHILSTWTNIWPWLGAAPEFYDKGKEFRTLLREAEKGKRWPGPSKLSELQYDNYGYLLFDFKDKFIVSCNGYYYPGMWNILDLDSDDAKQVKEMFARDWVSNVYNARSREPDSDDFYDILDGKDPKNPDNKQKLLDWCDNLNRSHYFTMKYCPKGWVIINYLESDDERDNLTHLKAFVRAHGWKSPVKG